MSDANADDPGSLSLKVRLTESGPVANFTSTVPSVPPVTIGILYAEALHQLQSVIYELRTHFAESDALSAAEFDRGFKMWMDDVGARPSPADTYIQTHREDEGE